MQYLTFTQAARRVNLSRRTLYGLVDRGRLTRYTVPGVHAPRLSAEELDNLYEPDTSAGGRL